MSEDRPVTPAEQVSDEAGRIILGAYLTAGEQLRYSIKLSEGAQMLEAERLFAMLEELEARLWQWKEHTEQGRGPRRRR